MHRPEPLQGLTLLLSGRHDLFVASLAALLSGLGAAVRLHSGSLESVAWARLDGVKLVVLESPMESELARVAAGPLPVIVLADQSTATDAGRLAELGAAAVLPKNASLAELSLAMSQAVERGPRRSALSLTERQRDVLRLIAEGLDNGEIARRLGISQRTVRAHVSSLLERLEVSNRTQAAVTALRSGWIA